MYFKPRLLFLLVAAVLVASCAGVQKVERPEGAFEIALLAVTDTRGELEPCG